MSSLIDSIRSEYLRYKQLGEGAIAQTRDEDLLAAAGADDNSIAVICQHLSGNLRSRFTDFLTTDGEKPWRDRESEFDRRSVTRATLLDEWANGWNALLTALDGLTDADLQKTVTIRQQPLLVHEALHRSLAHTAYHMGQIVYLAKAFRGSAWTSLSIPRGQSETYNKNPTREKIAQ
jgi:uncharacterized damage-inducible protein DinB